MKTITLTVLFVLISMSFVNAQQISLNSLYNINRYHVNSAYAGFDDGVSSYLSHRAQWVGIQSAPSTSFLSVQSSVLENVGIGGMIMYDNTDLTNTFSGVGTYAYRIKLGEEHNLRFGLSAGIYQTTLTPSDAIVDDQSDEVFANGNYSQLSFKNDVGLYYNYRKLEFGFSIPQVFETAKIGEMVVNRANVEMKRHIVAYLGYELPIGTKLDFQPSVLYRGFAANNNQFDINAQVTYDNLISIGAGYRTDVGFIGRFGLEINDLFEIGYAYEFGGAKLRAFTSGTHEVMLGIKFGAKGKRKRVETPSPNKQETNAIESEKSSTIEKKDTVQAPVVKDEPIIDEIDVAEEPVLIEESIEKESSIDLSVFDFKLKFPLNATDLDPSFEDELDKIVEVMLENPELNVTVIGHSCDLGSIQVKKNIAIKRATMVKAYVVKKGVEENRVTTKGEGDAQPIVPNTSEENRAKNRRVEFVVDEAHK
ncbi:PorP/SprF family type IX secretion system membrane protein [Brumimicrobium oceani]|nr:PorP/SprF family type IX secretion system membrane protein [Brumimicrobium oceani]